MSSNESFPQPVSRGPHWSIKLIISLVILFHFSAILSHVLSGGGVFLMRQLSSLYRPYLKTMWLDNAYRFYAPNPGDTEVLWYKLQYEDGSTRWTQVPRREDFYLRMPFQRTMSIALLGSMMIEREPVGPKEDIVSVANVLVNNQVPMKSVLTASGEIFFRSFARHIGRKECVHPATGSPLVSMDCFLVHYQIRNPIQMRMNYDMYDPRMLDVQLIATFSPEGVMSNFQQGFKDRMADDLFVELIQNEILPMLEANKKLPVEQRKSIIQILEDYGIPYPLIQPIKKKLSADEQEKFFEKPYDRDSLRERYIKLVKRDDRHVKPDIDPIKGEQQTGPGTVPSGAKATEPAQRGIQ
ncbi:MAG TPA: hypothetical protein PLN21_02965 [Gemmatales bacterium]|nr:hypothetical protein [Gemmatales bacterium]